jgi:hypothetical protein
MRGRAEKYLFLLILTALCGAFLRPAWAPPAGAEAPAAPAAKDDEELARLFREDQADRKAAKIDWAVVGPRDRKREARVKELYKGNRLRTGADCYHAAMVLQHGPAPEDYLLAHELCVVAVGKGEKRAAWLAAASEDRFLMSVGRPQRFGTQFRGDAPGGKIRLYKVDPGVTDDLRRAFGVPPLADAKAQEAKLNEKQGTAKP